MKAVKHAGTCKICGEFKKLSFEHVPPRHAFNSNKVIKLPFGEVVKTMTGTNGRMPWDTTGLKGKFEQRGSGDYYLCDSCNNNTGTWYMNDYCSFAGAIHNIICEGRFEVGKRYSFVINDLYPLRLYKAVMTMFCDINNIASGNDELREFLLNKESKILNGSKYSLYIYLVSPGMKRISGVSAQLNMHTGSVVLSSEIATYPLGFAMYIEKPDEFEPVGLNMDCFSQYSYEDKYNITFEGVPYIEINSQLPIDYRSKDDIIKCIQENNDKKENI